MKLFQQLLVAPAAIGLLAPLSAYSSEVNFEAISNRTSLPRSNPYFSFISEKSSKLTTTQAIIMFLPEARFNSSIAIFNWWVKDL